MGSCYACRRHIGILCFECHSCKSVFCSRCRMPEDHACPALEQMKQKKRNELSEKLLNEATQDNHNIVEKI